MNRLILASGSPRRQELLKQMGVVFEVVVPSVTEWEDAAADPLCMVAHNARIKAEAVAKDHPDCWIMGADTTVAIESVVLNKPKDMADAYAMLRLLSGKTHNVHTAVCWMHRDKHVLVEHTETTQVHFAVLDDAAIAAYFRVIDPLDKAGAYAIQKGLGSVITGYEGSLTNVVGLPVEWVQSLLRQYQLLK